MMHVRGTFYFWSTSLFALYCTDGDHDDGLVAPLEVRMQACVLWSLMIVPPVYLVRQHPPRLRRGSLSQGQLMAGVGEIDNGAIRTTYGGPDGN